MGTEQQRRTTPSERPRPDVGQLIWTPEQDRRLHQLREQFITDPRTADISQLSPVIQRSWKRSLACQVDPDGQDVQFDDSVHLDEQFMQTAGPVIQQLVEGSMDTGISISLADANGTIAAFSGDRSSLRPYERRLTIVGSMNAEDVVGTNGEGTAVEEGTAVQIWGSEHFAAGLQHFCCTSIPIRDPIRRSIRAILTVAVPSREAEGLSRRLLALIAQGAATEITQLLTARLTMREQALMSAYIAESRKRGSDAVVVMDERTTIASRGALEMLSDSDYGVLAGYAQESTQGGRAFDREVALMNGSQVTVTARPIESAGDRSGSLLRLHRPVVPSRIQHREERRPRPEGFSRLVGHSTALRRALEVASTAVDRRQAAYIVGEGGTGKSELALAIAGCLQPAVTVFETDADHPVLEGGVAAVQSAIEQGSAVIIKRADQLPTETRADLATLFGAAAYAPVVLTYARPIRLNDTGLVDSLQAVEIEVPPLRARRDDIPSLIHHFLNHNGHGVLSASPAVVQAAVKAEWSGNVRQLKNFIDTAAARCPTSELAMAHLSDGQRRLLSTTPLSRLEEAELHQIRDALADSGGNRVRAAALLQIGRSTLYRKITAYERRGYELDK